MRYQVKVVKNNIETLIDFPDQGIKDAVSEAAKYIKQQNVFVSIFDAKIQKIILQKGCETKC